jgi:hypothetical protein
VKLRSFGESLFMSAVYLAPDVLEVSYELFVRDVELTDFAVSP